jgi:hypothetical protein
MITTFGKSFLAVTAALVCMKSDVIPAILILFS